jgi:hypothetical protein
MEVSELWKSVLFRDQALVGRKWDRILARKRKLGMMDRILDIELLLERANFYRGSFALYEALHGFRNNDQEAFTSGMEEYR